MAPPSIDELDAPRVTPGGEGSALLGSGSGRRGDSIFKGVALAAGLIVLAVLALIAWSTTKEAWPAFKDQGLSFITSDVWIPSEGKYGALAFIWGTLLSSAIALVLAVPVSLGIALYTNEAAPKRMRKWVVYVMDLLAAIPSVVYGLWGVLVLAPAIQPVYKAHQRRRGRRAGAGLVLQRRQRPQLHDRRHHPRHHDHPDRHLAQP